MFVVHRYRILRCCIHIYIYIYIYTYTYVPIICISYVVHMFQEPSFRCKHSDMIMSVREFMS